MLRALWSGLTILAAAVSIGWGTGDRTDELTIKDIMHEAHRKPDELLKKVATGQATEQQKKRLLELYEALAKNEPPQGDASSWKAKTDLLIAAAKAAVEGKPDAGAQLNKAANCKSCHEEHK